MPELSDSVASKLLLVIITLCFTAIIGLIGYLAKKLIEDIGNNIKSLVLKFENQDQKINNHSVQLAQHQLQIEYIQEKIKIKSL